MAVALALIFVGIVFKVQAALPRTPILTQNGVKLVAGTPDDDAYFGAVTAMHLDTLVVGSPRQGDPGNQTGAVHIFTRNTGGADQWGLVKVLTPPAGADGDRFGTAISVYGDTLVVGAPAATGGAAGSGVAYVFRRNTGGADSWGLVATLTYTGASAGDLFGTAVAMDSQHIVVGAPGDDVMAVDGGAAYVFARNRGGVDNWGLVSVLTHTQIQGGHAFGTAVAIDEGKIATGAPFAATGGAAYVFARNQGGADVWGLVGTLTTATTVAGDEFGASIAIDHDRVVAGAPQAGGGAGNLYLFERNQGGADAWGLLSQLEDAHPAAGNNFGADVALDGNIALAGVPGAGAIYVFERNFDPLNPTQPGADSWGLVQALSGPDSVAGDRFGAAVALSGDTIAGGAPRAVVASVAAGAAYTFKYDANAWVLQQQPSVNVEAGDFFGSAVAIDGDTLIVGASAGDTAVATNSGVAYVFERNQDGADRWGRTVTVTFGAPNSGDQFGSAVALAGDLLVVGAYGDDDKGNNAGAAYVFSRNQGGPGNWGQVAKLTAGDGAAGDRFGYAVSISGDTVVVGADKHESGGRMDAGAAYIFQRNAGGADNWGQAAKLMAPLPETVAQFGYAVSINGDTIVVGAPYGRFSGLPTGVVYVYSRNQGGADWWGLEGQLIAADASLGDYFGSAVSLQGDIAVVGAEQPTRGPGAAYIFSRNQGGAGSWQQVIKLTTDDVSFDDRFGASVALRESTVLIGAYQQDNSASNAGAAYIFSRNQDGADRWQLVGRFHIEDAGSDDHFGVALATSGDQIAIGAPRSDRQQVDGGAVYIYTLQPQADLVVEKFVIPANVAPGQTVTYTIDFSNVGLLTATGVLITDAIPSTLADLTYSGSGSFVAVPGTTYTWQIPALSPGQGGVITVTGALRTGIPGGASLTNAVTITTVSAETNRDNNSAVALTLVQNVAPVAMDDVTTTVEDTVVTIPVLANDSDANGDALQVTAVSAPDYGSAVIDAGTQVVYTPENDFSGVDAFTYTVSDGMLTDVAWITVTVTNLDNDPPLAVGDWITTAEDMPVSVPVLLNDSDPDPGTTLSVLSVQSGANGTATTDGITVAYVPALNFNGPDVFTYTISDGVLTATAQVSVAVLPVNDPPVAVDDMATTTQDTAVQIGVLNNDTDPDAGDSLSVETVGFAQHGMAFTQGVTITYNPDTGFTGTDVFTYQVTDLAGLSAIATVTVIVEPPTHILTAVPDSVTTDEDHPVSLAVLSNDIRSVGYTLTVKSLGTPSNGVVSTGGFTITYTPALNFYGTDTFTYTASDGDLEDTTQVTVTVNPVNDLPVLSPIPDQSMQVDTVLAPVVFTVNDVETAPDDLDLAVTSSNPALIPASNITISGTGITRTLNLSPVSGMVGTSILTLTVDDGEATGDAAFTLTVFEPIRLYLALTQRYYAAGPDLVVESLIITGDNIQVVIKNQGDRPVDHPFWVDVYINPNPIPDRVNQTWPMLSDEGLAWGVTSHALPLEPGATLLLAIGDDYYVANESNFSGVIETGTRVYAQVDSAYKDVSYGAILENHEIAGTKYNNITGLRFTGRMALNGADSLPVLGGTILSHLPPRPVE